MTVDSDLISKIKENLFELSKKTRLTSISTEELNLPPRIYNALGRSGITNLRRVYQQLDNIFFGNIKYIGENESIEFSQKLINYLGINKKNQVSDHSENEILKNKGIIIANNVLSEKKETEEIEISNLSKNISDLVVFLYYLSSKINEIDLGDGKKTIILPKIERYELRSEESRGVLTKVKEFELIEKEIEEIFSQLKERDIEIVNARIGFDPDERKTLQVISDEFGITRERVRQIEKRVLNRIKQLMCSAKESYIFEFLYRTVKNNEICSKKTLVNELQKIITGSNYKAAEVINYLFYSFENEIFFNNNNKKLIYINELDVFITESESIGTLLMLSEKLIDLLSKTILPLKWKDLFEILSSELTDVKISESKAFKLLCFLKEKNVINENEEKWTITDKRKITRVDRIKFIMGEIGKPTHFREIAKVYNQYFPDYPMKVNNVHSTLDVNCEFVLAGRGKYALAEWGFHHDGNVANAVRRILVNKKCPMNIQEIEYEVQKTWDVQKFTILSAIDMDARFRKNESGLIELTEYGKKTEKRHKRDDEERLDRIVEIFEYAKTPCSAKTIVEMHNHLYAEKPLKVNSVKYLMLRKTEIFMKVNEKNFALVTWGLNAYEEPGNQVGSSIMEILQEFEPLKLKDILEIYNQKYSNKKISEQTLRKHLKKLSNKVFSPKKNYYQINSQVIAINPDQKNAINEKAKKIINILKEIGSPAHIDFIHSMYKSYYPSDNGIILELKNILRFKRDYFYLIENDVYGLSDWK